MSERLTPETDAAQLQAENNCNILRPSGWGFARQMERERDEAREALTEETKFHHRTHGECVQAQCELMDVKKERDEQTAQMCQAIGYLSTIAEDCEAWLNGESDEPSMEFIQKVRDYARKAVNNE